jgi:hypothetical protein
LGATLPRIIAPSGSGLIQTADVLGWRCRVIRKIVQRKAVRWCRRSWKTALLFLLSARPTVAQERPCGVTRVDVEGVSKLAPSVVYELLPRDPPACFTNIELQEFERRLWALQVFDSVEVRLGEDSALRVKVREKWTLIPGGDFAIGPSFVDSYFLVYATESNLFGRAQGLYVSAAYSERQIRGEISWWEHEQAARRVTFGASAYHIASDIFFDDPTFWWTRRRAGGRLGLRFPFGYGSQLHPALFAIGYREISEGHPPPDLLREGELVGLGSRIAWDAYAWHDLSPSGFRLAMELTCAGFFSEAPTKNRSSATLTALAALRINETTAVLVNAAIEGAVPGDPNHSFLLGNLRGVRGLSGGLLRNALHGFSNVELRFATGVARRWFLQGVAFVDSAVYWRMNEHGKTQSPQDALGAGIGMRVVPTSISSVVPRIDLGSLLIPEQVWFFNFGISQYF